MKNKNKNQWDWRCQECEYTFKTVKSAQKAAFGNKGCPKCGSTDIDMSLPLTNKNGSEEKNDN